MATASATLSAATFMAAATVGGSSMARKAMKVKKHNNSISGINSYGGLKAENGVTSLGVPVCTEQSFAKIVSSLRAPSSSKSKGRRSGGRGGALSSTCNATDEIFKIAAIMNGLTLIGVAVGFALLRLEAIFEESE